MNDLLPASAASGSIEILVTIRVGDAWYAMDAMQVQEVILVPLLTPVHGSEPYIRGIINLRGKIIPVFDMGARIGLPAVTKSPVNRILVIPSEGELIGLLVDEIGDVAYPAASDFRALPRHVPQAQARFYSGVVQTPKRLLTLLNPLPLGALPDTNA